LCSEISKCKLEATVLPVDEDLDGDQCVGTNRPRVGVRRAHVDDLIEEEAVSKAPFGDS